MTLSHRLLFHRPLEVTWISPLLTFTLKNWMVFAWPEGFECVKAAHDTTQHSQRHDKKCLSEAMIWFSPLYMSIKQFDFLTASYVVRQAMIQLALYGGVALAWPSLSTSARLWVLLLLFVAPVVSRTLFYFGHSFLHTPRTSLLFAKSQNFTLRPYDRQAHNLRLHRLPRLSKYVLGLVFLGDHLHNNHHHAPNALCQAYGPHELDGFRLWLTLFRVLRLLSIDSPQTARAVETQT